MFTSSTHVRSSGTITIKSNKDGRFQSSSIDKHQTESERINCQDKMILTRAMRIAPMDVQSKARQNTKPNREAQSWS